MKDHLSDFDPQDKAGAMRPSRVRRCLPGVAWVSFLAFLVFAPPKFEMTFADFGVDLPRVTVYFIEASHAVHAHAPTLLVVLAAAWVVADASRCGDRRPCRVRWAVTFLIPVGLLVLGVFAFSMPMLALFHRLKG